MIRRWVAACLSAALALVGVPVASAQVVQPFPVSPTSPEVSGFWFGSDSRTDNSTGPLSLRMDSVSPRVADLGDTLTVELTLTNRTGDTITDLSLRTQRSDALPTPVQSSLAMAEPESTFTTVTQFSEATTLAPRSSTTVTLSVPLSDPGPDGLSVTEPGVYPILVNANGAAGDGILRQLAETRTLIPVEGEPNSASLDDVPLPGVAAPGEQDPADLGVAPDEAAVVDGDDPRPISMIWPISETVPILPGETGDAPEKPDLILTDNSLSESMAEGGRLHRMVSSMQEALDGEGGNELGFATCIAVDPELLVTASRMSGGYLIGSERSDPNSAGVRLRDSWTHNDDIDAEPASAADVAVAADWLQQLRDLTEGQCTVPMPWANASAAAVSSIADPATTEIWTSGEGYLADLLDTTPVSSVLLPPEGRLRERATEVLGAAPGSGGTTALVASTAVSSFGPEARPGAAVELPHGIRGVVTPTDLNTALAATGPEPSVAGYSREIGRHRLTNDSVAARMQTAIGTLHSEINDGRGAEGVDGDGGALIIVPPGDWSVSEEGMAIWLGAVKQTMADGRTVPAAFGDAVGHLAEDASAGPAALDPSITNAGEVTASEIGRAVQQARYTSELTGLMVEDPDISLTPAGFTLPIYRDILRSVSVNGRNHADGYDTAAAGYRTIQEQTGTMIQALRESVRLITPGSRYTRATGASPVAVVASNGLPLPVDATVVLEGEGMAAALEEPTRLPARGSLTLQLYPDVNQADSRRSDLQVRLETPDGRAISAPVAITVQSGFGSGLFFVLTVLFLIGAGVLARRRWRKQPQNRPGNGR